MRDLKASINKLKKHTGGPEDIELIAALLERSVLHPELTADSFKYANLISMVVTYSILRIVDETQAPDAFRQNVHRNLSKLKSIAGDIARRLHALDLLGRLPQEFASSQNEFEESAAGITASLEAYKNTMSGLGDSDCDVMCALREEFRNSLDVLKHLNKLRSRLLTDRVSRLSLEYQLSYHLFVTRESGVGLANLQHLYYIVMAVMISTVEPSTYTDLAQGHVWNIVDGVTGVYDLLCSLGLTLWVVGLLYYLSHLQFELHLGLLPEAFIKIASISINGRMLMQACSSLQSGTAYGAIDYGLFSKSMAAAALPRVSPVLSHLSRSSLFRIPRNLYREQGWVIGLQGFRLRHPRPHPHPHSA